MGRTKSLRRGKPLEEVMTAVVQELRRGSASKDELVRSIGGTSPQTVQKALDRLRDEHDAPIEFEERTKSWILRDKDFTLPLDAPEPEDLVAVLLAEAIVAPLADEQLRTRLRRLAEQMDGRMRARHAEGAAPPRAAMTASLTLGTRVEPAVLQAVLASTRRAVVRILYYSPWKDEHERATIEPWEVRIHDGAGYLRAWCREAAAARTYRLVHVAEVERMSGRPSVPVPVGERVWGDELPAYGIDRDRPGEAVIVLRGAVARWVHGIVWHPQQQDRWLEGRERLERRLPYRSCRELARRVLSVVDAVEDVAPAELRDEVARCVRAWA